MARTRSQKRPAPEEFNEEEEHQDAENGTQDQDDSDKPPSSFNGQLTKYNYTASATSSPSKPPSTSIQNAKPMRKTSTSSPSPTKPTTPSQSPAPKKKRKSSKYAPPSTYAHLSPLTDILAPNLIAIFIGTNPGIRTATAGHAYAHPSNSFWKLLYSSGLTPDRRLSPTEDGTLPAKYLLGNTNIVARPSKDAAELSKSEMAAGTRDLEEKCRIYKPEAVCVVGKGIWEAVWRWRYGRGFRKGEFGYGWQDEGENLGREEGDGWEGSRVYVTSSTSGLAASLRPEEKEEIWRPFGEWVQQRRRERGFVVGGGEG